MQKDRCDLIGQPFHWVFHMCSTKCWRLKTNVAKVWQYIDVQNVSRSSQYSLSDDNEMFTDAPRSRIVQIVLSWVMHQINNDLLFIGILTSLWLLVLAYGIYWIFRLILVLEWQHFLMDYKEVSHTPRWRWNQSLFWSDHDVFFDRCWFPIAP